MKIQACDCVFTCLTTKTAQEVQTGEWNGTSLKGYAVVKRERDDGGRHACESNVFTERE